jgi:hypothetical protein
MIHSSIGGMGTVPPIEIRIEAKLRFADWFDFYRFESSHFTHTPIIAGQIHVAVRRRFKQTHVVCIPQMS